MTYFNFFYTQQARKKNRGFGVKQMLILGAVFLVICACIYGYYLIQRNRYRDQLEYVESIKANEDFNAQYKAALAAKEAGADLKTKLLEISVLSDVTGGATTANSALLKLIDTCITENVTITRIKVSDFTVDFDGKLPSIEKLTELERNLDATGAFSSVLISLIENRQLVGPAAVIDTETEDDGMLMFTGKLMLNGGVSE